jgi:hypothetical protein
MTKRFNPPKIDQTEPVGDITEANPPLAVFARINWNYGGPMTVDNAWAIAWTREQVLVIWLIPGVNYPMAVWLRADQVRRR